jgi:hypothetical protein
MALWVEIDARQSGCRMWYVSNTKWGFSPLLLVVLVSLASAKSPIYRCIKDGQTNSVQPGTQRSQDGKSGGKISLESMVGVTGFEPATPTSRRLEAGVRIHFAECLRNVFS